MPNVLFNIYLTFSRLISNDSYFLSIFLRDLDPPSHPNCFCSWFNLLETLEAPATDKLMLSLDWPPWFATKYTLIHLLAVGSVPILGTNSCNSGNSYNITINEVVDINTNITINELVDINTNITINVIVDINTFDNVILDDITFNQPKWHQQHHHINTSDKSHCNIFSFFLSQYIIFGLNFFGVNILKTFSWTYMVLQQTRLDQVLEPLLLCSVKILSNYFCLRIITLQHILLAPPWPYCLAW